MQFYSKKRISIIVEAVYRDRVIELIDESGASGYTVYKNICGKGRHGLKVHRGGLEQSGNVEIVTITGLEVAEKILRGLQKMIDNEIVLIVHIIDVSVIRNNHFN